MNSSKSDGTVSYSFGFDELEIVRTFHSLENAKKKKAFILQLERVVFEDQSAKESKFVLDYSPSQLEFWRAQQSRYFALDTLKHLIFLETIKVREDLAEDPKFIAFREDFYQRALTKKLADDPSRYVKFRRFSSEFNSVLERQRPGHFFRKMFRRVAKVLPLVIFSPFMAIKMLTIAIGRLPIVPVQLGLRCLLRLSGGQFKSLGLTSGESPEDVEVLCGQHLDYVIDTLSTSVALSERAKALNAKPLVLTNASSWIKPEWYARLIRRNPYLINVQDRKCENMDIQLEQKIGSVEKAVLLVQPEGDICSGLTGALRPVCEKFCSRTLPSLARLKKSWNIRVVSSPNNFLLFGDLGFLSKKRLPIVSYIHESLPGDLLQHLMTTGKEKDIGVVINQIHLSYAKELFKRPIAGINNATQIFILSKLCSEQGVRQRDYGNPVVQPNLNPASRT